MPASVVSFGRFRRPLPPTLFHDTVGALDEFPHAFVVHTNRRISKRTEDSTRDHPAPISGDTFELGGFCSVGIHLFDDGIADQSHAVGASLT